MIDPPVGLPPGGGASSTCAPWRDARLRQEPLNRAKANDLRCALCAGFKTGGGVWKLMPSIEAYNPYNRHGLPGWVTDSLVPPNRSWRVCHRQTTASVAPRKDGLAVRAIQAAEARDRRRLAAGFDSAVGGTSKLVSAVVFETSAPELNGSRCLLSPAHVNISRRSTRHAHPSSSSGAASPFTRHSSSGRCAAANRRRGRCPERADLL